MTARDDSGVVLEVPGRQIRLSTDVKVTAVCGVDKVEAFNNEKEKSSHETKAALKAVRGFASGVERWKCIIASDVCLLNANSVWVVAACFNGVVHVISASTGVLCFTFTTDSAPASLALEKSYLSIITGAGFIYVWNIEQGKAILPKKSCLDVFNEGDVLEKHLITSAGSPVLHFSSGKTFTFASGCWQMISDNRSIVARCSSTVPHPSVLGQSDLFSLLGPLQTEPLCVDDATRLSATYSLMEERLNAACVWQCEEEYLAFLDCYVRWLLKTDNTERLNNLVCRLKEQQSWFGNLSADKVSTAVEKIVRQSAAIEQKLENCCHATCSSNSSNA